MANGDTPPRDYDLSTARATLRRARSKLNEIEPTSSIEHGLKNSMSSPLDSLELAHTQLALQQMTCQSLWQLLDALGMQLRRCRDPFCLRQDMLEQARNAKAMSSTESRAETRLPLITE